MQLSDHFDSETLERFWINVDVRDTDECWNWKAGKTLGYGMFSLKGKSHPVHRLSYIMHNGDIDDVITIGHICKNRACVNPGHLFLKEKSKVINPRDLDTDVLERFWIKVDKQGPTECWEWTAYKNKKGYGRFVIKGSMYLAHRIAYTIKYGKISPGMLICHTCDNPSCCNPDHLFAGTDIDNNQDCASKNRHAKEQPRLQGEKNGHSKLTEKEVIEIRAKYIPWIYSLRMLAKEYGVGRSEISQIINRKIWKYI